jgi:hypothetical protein
MSDDAQRITIAEYSSYIQNTTTEKEFQRVVCDLSVLLGWRKYHTFDARRSDLGFPDLVLVRDTVLLFVELKTEKGKVRPEQESWGQALVQVEGAVPWNVKYRLWRPSQWDEIVATLARSSDSSGV